LISRVRKYLQARVPNEEEKPGSSGSRRIISKVDIEALKNLAIDLEARDPVSSYKLYKLALKFRPKGKFLIRKEATLREQLFGCMLTSRKDGTTERLLSIVYGLLIAEKSGIPFRFSWATDIGAVFNEHCSVDNFLPSFFRPDFVDSFYIDFSDMKRYEVSGFPVPSCEVCSAVRVKQALSAERKDVLQKKFLNFAPPVRIDPELKTSIGNELFECAKRVFRDEYLSLIPEFKSELGGHLGIHYRGGDVIYGKFRHGEHAIGRKSAPLPIIEDILTKNMDNKIVLFGTPKGETLDDMRFLARKYGNVTLATSYARGELDHVVQDAIMMSCCDSLIAYENTGVAQLAFVFNPKLNQESYDNLYSPGEFFKICSNNTGNLEYNKIQRSYINVRALALCDLLEVPDKTREFLLSNISTLDPGNKLNWLEAE
jgi:hypothetical protein